MAGFVDKLQRMWNPPEEEYDDDDYYDEEEEYEEESGSSDDRGYQKNEIQPAPSLFRRSNKIVNMNQHQKPQLQVVVFKPMSFGEDTSEIAHALMNKSAVVLNLERTAKDESRRILDFLSGVAFAQGGKISHIATATFIITPYNVDLTGDEVFDEFENSGVYF